MTIIKETIHLSNEEIASFVDRLWEAYAKAAGNRAIAETKVKLAAEELLLNCKACYGEEIECIVRFRKEFGQLKLELFAPGVSMDPFNPDAEPDDMNGCLTDILQRLEVIPKYEYYHDRGGYNKITLPIDKKPSKNSFMIQIAVALALALALYFVLKLFDPSVTIMLRDELTLPIFSKITLVISAIATPLVFFAVISGILGVGDVTAFGKIGKKLLTEMLYSYLCIGVIFGVVGGLVYYSGNNTVNTSESVIGQILTLVLDIIPSNLVEPFLTDNDLPVITLSVFSGVVVLLLGKKLHRLPKIITELSLFFNKMMMLICKLLPAVVFLGVFNMLVSGEMKNVVQIYKMALLFVLCAFIFIIILTLRTRRITGIPIGLSLKRQLSAFMIVLTTSSQVAALPENSQCLKDTYGLDPRFVDFSLPLCVVIYMPCGAAFIGFIMFSLGALAGIPITLAMIIKIVFVGIIIAVAAPPIPGSAFAVMPIVFTACGIPDSVYPIAIIIGTVIGYFLPAMNCYCLQEKILITAYRLGLVKKE